ncbi:hypothetical protein SCALIN_C01_0165 [Candidatus Scalindua japonica]|uniref:Uncharacterized protein n=1 Tax=Candidatus Scalindua japonica TaxID=1284222 RepID=A0A286TTP0_9BACT|nr:tetratricopeptide repeat protein [Candidatus Scalindua japonica]GAX59234.1 hypothetical protein SCALIN_C01_0165 [Candidatus Scalindua japonica]
MSRIAILGVALVTGGVFLFHLGQEVKNRLYNNHLHQSINEKSHEVEELTNNNNNALKSRDDNYQKVLLEKEAAIQQLTVRADTQKAAAEEYQKYISEKDSIINQLTEQVDKQKLTTEEYRKTLTEKDEAYHKLTEQLEKLNVVTEVYQKKLSEKEAIIHQLTARVDKQKGADIDKEGLSKRNTTINQHKSWFEKLLHKSEPRHVSSSEKESGKQDLKETEYDKEIAHARNLYKTGRYDDAYKIADNLRQKFPENGQAYLVLGTIEIHREHCDNGELLLNKAIKLGLTDRDKAWAFHNLGIASVRKKSYEKAEEFLVNAIELDSNMEKSKKALLFLQGYLQRKSLIIKARSLCKMGKYDDAYRIADDLRQKYPEDGLPYFILGTIEMQNEHYDKGEDLLNKAVKMDQSDEDRAWAFHSLGISSARKNNIEKAREYLVKAVELNPGMTESRKALKLLDDLD